MKRTMRLMIKPVVVMLLAALLLAGIAPGALAEAFSAIVTAKSMTVYGEVTMTEKLGALDKNTVVRVTGYTSKIAKIEYNGRIGYAKVSDMKRVDAVAEKGVLNAAALIYESPSEDGLSVSMPAGTLLYVLAESGDWAWVERDGKVGYIKAGQITKMTAGADPSAAAAPTDAQITEQNGITVRTYNAVTIESMTVYKSASEKARVLGTLKTGIEVTVKATSGDGWAYIELNGKHGYCRVSSLREGVAEDHTPAPTATAAAARQGVVGVDGLSVYQQASTKSKQLGTLTKGQTVNVVNWNSEWAYIELDGNYGFCALSGLTQAGSEATLSPTVAPDTSNAKTGTVTAASLIVYESANAGAKKLGTLKKNQTVNVLKTSGDWAYIELKGNYGFCSAKGLSVSDSDEGVPSGFKQEQFKATVVTSDARVYARTNTNSENVALKQGAEVQVVAYNATWACVLQNGSYGFVPVKALSKASYAPISGDGEALQTLLKALLSGGYYDAVPGTSYNAAAIAAIKRFQSACGLEQSGVADEAMLRIVYSGYAPASSLLYSTLKSGDKNDNVGRVQARLYALGYLTKTGSLDGSYGSTTVAAVKLFQNASGITATGTADSATLKALYSTEAKRLPSGSKAADASSSSSGSSSSTYLDSVPNGLASVTSSYSSGMSNAEKLEHTIYLAQSKLGSPYVYGATGSEKFDCSGLTTWIFKAVGVSLKRSAYNQGYDESYQKIEGNSNLRRGDLVFFNTISDSDLSDHVGIYLGEGYFIHASSGAHKVVVSNLTTGFYARVYSWGRRILK